MSICMCYQTRQRHPSNFGRLNITITLNTVTDEMSLFIDGELEDYNEKMTSDLTMFDHEFYGMWDNFNTFSGTYSTGTIDEVRIYNRVLSEAEVQSLYQNP